MTNIELVLNMLAEVTTTELSRKRKPDSFPESREIAVEGGIVARDARNNIEERLGMSVISSSSAKDTDYFSETAKNGVLNEALENSDKLPSSKKKSSAKPEKDN